MRRRTLSVLIIVGLLGPACALHATTTTANNISHVLRIACMNEGASTYVTGSGVVIDSSLVVTNAHVVTDARGDVYDFCFAGFTASSYTAPTFTLLLSPTPWYRWNDDYDYAFMAPYDEHGNAYTFNSWAIMANGDSMTLGEAVTTMGYPGSGGGTITITSGEVTGFRDGSWIKTDAPIDSGSSGGGAFDSMGNLFGVTTAVGGTYNATSYIQNINTILEGAFGAQHAVRDYSTLYESNNRFCLFDSCYQYAPDESTWDNFQATEEDAAISAPADPYVPAASPVYSVPTHAAYSAARFDAAMQNRVRGYILLQVDQHGEAWYVNTHDGLRYYLRDGAIAYQMLRTFGLGVTDSDLSSIPSVGSVHEMAAASSVCATHALANRVKGQILLQVQQHGEAWYIHPQTCRRIYMKDGDVAYATMRYLSLGISDSDLAKLPYSTTMVFK